MIDHRSLRTFIRLHSITMATTRETLRSLSKKVVEGEKALAELQRLMKDKGKDAAEPSGGPVLTLDFEEILPPPPIPEAMKESPIVTEEALFWKSPLSRVLKRDQVYSVLSSNPGIQFSLHELEKRLPGINRSTIAAECSYLKTKGYVTSERRGVYTFIRNSNV